MRENETDKSRDLITPDDERAYLEREIERLEME